MSIATEIARLQDAKTSIRNAIASKGVSVPTSAKLDTYASYIDDISGGTVPTTTIQYDGRSDINIMYTKVSTSTGEPALENWENVPPITDFYPVKDSIILIPNADTDMYMFDTDCTVLTTGYSAAVVADGTYIYIG